MGAEAGRVGPGAGEREEETLGWALQNLSLSPWNLLLKPGEILHGAVLGGIEWGGRQLEGRALWPPCRLAPSVPSQKVTFHVSQQPSGLSRSSLFW